MKRLLDHIDFPSDLRKVEQSELPQLAKEIREFIINIVATKEGHLGASLGVVELTIALHYVFNTPDDLLVWDVGHQAYGHKILTGRKSIFHTNRQWEGISGFPKRDESDYDTFGVGHSSTAISAALGMAIASKIKRESRNHIAVIGDASIASGMAFEGLNHAGVTDANLLVILNDNAIGIDPSVGALKQYLTNVKKGEDQQDNIFEALNFNYSGPIDGHDLNTLISELERLKDIKGPKFLHVITTKGKGLKQAETDQVKYHAPGKFDAKTGDLIPKESSSEAPKFQDVFGHTIVELAKSNESIIGITPAMPTGSSLKFMMDQFPDRAFDVGIAEQHAVTLAAGMATQGLIPFCNIYSTFLQRAYDQVIHDVALQNLPVVFCLDRAGLVGEDGATHHGVFDLAYLRSIPNMIICAPRNEIELRNIMYTVQTRLDHPIAIRYPRGRGRLTDWRQSFSKVTIGSGVQLREGSNIAVLSIGSMAYNVEDVLKNVDMDIAHFDMRFVKPLDQSLLHEIFDTYMEIVTIEDGVITGGFGSAISEFASKHSYKNKLHILGVPDKFIEHGSIKQQHQSIKIDAGSLTMLFQSILQRLS
ncbi:1-deoxy-D-xylulose-5-phosphate synthase [Psychroserpens sp.]|uniref:1-deoxy-D-xylulose-5-phosphate synthase n=1 Tax=Psychroserpens sp. TaxID=2020870 RepID=UPI001B0294B5|nr:1-deoxy-D-xylulose-5-phosphate synthase [Psychroserpens sp.]MBO6607764.1 1-deoxy-D-xylulose-5-phosphate synthase [Psychroserpens sp.]MBO6631003.1 1-deoxy-D-xylulose-5-phosphate synthase [Psychroserpens sp.]MBO6654755.1 1-deoxy-D-xylulose-5-phosphate synthase [Psychroserpens sp.]MBO6682821.1 1-deoxy-D-xylulose-5-phosphate synthase [Psychroserpens sp.]MBO6751122.1 1-deoxy-D-xylulose-5-phosphate synthase [Psychroserpens sp.]